MATSSVRNLYHVKYHPPASYPSFVCRGGLVFILLCGMYIEIISLSPLMADAEQVRKGPQRDCLLPIVEDNGSNSKVKEPTCSNTYARVMLVISVSRAWKRSGLNGKMGAERPLYVYCIRDNGKFGRFRVSRLDAIKYRRLKVPRRLRKCVCGWQSVVAGFEPIACPSCGAAVVLTSKPKVKKRGFSL